MEVVRLLIEQKADMNIRNANNDAAVHSAAVSDSVEVIRLLLDNVMSDNLTNTYVYGTVPLHVSAASGNLQTAKSMVKINVAVNSSNTYSETPLMLVACQGKLELFPYLTEIGADINIRDARKGTALHLAAESDTVDVIKLLLGKGMSVN